MGSEIGPVDYMIVVFPGNKFRGEIAPAITELVDAGTIRIIDIAFVGKGADGDTVALELTELDPEVQAALDSLGIEVGGLFNEDDLVDAGEASSRTPRPRCSSGRTSGRAKSQAMRDAGGELIAFERLPHDLVQAAREWALEAAGKEC